jgi:hypothetical protein
VANRAPAAIAEPAGAEDGPDVDRLQGGQDDLAGGRAPPGQGAGRARAGPASATAATAAAHRSGFRSRNGR